MDKTFIQFLTESDKLTNHKVGDIVIAGFPGSRHKRMGQITKLTDKEVHTTIPHPHTGEAMKFHRHNNLGMKWTKLGPPYGRTKAAPGSRPYLQKATDKDIEDDYKIKVARHLSKVDWYKTDIDKLNKVKNVFNMKTYHWKKGYI